MQTSAHTPFGDQLKRWRRELGLSQLQLAVDTGVSPRHLSFIETGRAQPSREMVLRLAAQLRLSLRAQNALLLAAGFAPAFVERGLDAPELDGVRRAARLVLESHEPFPAIALDRGRNVVMGNRAAALLCQGVAPSLLAPPSNIYRLILHPQGLARRIVDFPSYGRHLLTRLRRDVEVLGDPALEALLTEVEGYPGLDAPCASAPSDGALVLRLQDQAGELRFFTTIATFGTPFDVTVSELAIESLFPADEATAQRLRALGAFCST